ncbi:hypothetical protein ACFL4G_09535 [Thermodesulfobacteriota bacterium]
MRLRNCALITLVLIWTVGTVAAEPLGDPDIPDGQRIVYSYDTTYKSSIFLKDIKEMEEVRRSVNTIEHYEEEGKRFYRVRDRGMRANGYTFNHVTILERGGYLKPISFRASDSNPEGRIIREMFARFDDEALVYPEDTYPIFSSITAIRGLDFKPGSRAEVFLWLAPTEIYRIFIDVEAMETIVTAAGTFECYRLDLKPDIRAILPIGVFLASLLQPFLPEYYFWYSTEPSHPLVKFKGSLGGVGASYTVVELKEIEWGRGEPDPADAAMMEP